LQGATVSAEEFNSYFAERFRQKIGNVGFRELKLYLNNFIVKLIDMRKLNFCVADEALEFGK